MNGALILTNPAAEGVRRRRSFFSREQPISFDIEQYVEVYNAAGHDFTPDISQTVLLNGVFQMPFFDPGIHERLWGIGGDGTVLDFVTYLRHHHLENMPEIVWIPAGTGNGYAFALGLPNALEDLFLLGVEGKSKEVDILEITGGIDAYSLNFLGFGWTAEHIKRVEKLKERKQSRGIPAHVGAGLLNLIPHKPIYIEWLKVDGKIVERNKPAFDLIIAKGFTPGAGIWVAPPGPLDDGLARIVVYDAMNKGQILNSPLTCLNQHEPRHAKLYKGEHIEFKLREGHFIESDGNVISGQLQETQYSVRVIPKAYKIVKQF